MARACVECRQREPTYLVARRVTHIFVLFECVLLEAHRFDSLFGQTSPSQLHHGILITYRPSKLTLQRHDPPAVSYHGIGEWASSVSCRRIPRPECIKRVDDLASVTQRTLGNVVNSGNHVDKANTPPSVCGDVKAREER